MFHLLYEPLNSTNHILKIHDLMIRRQLRPNRLHFRGPCRRQNWSLSYLIIDYITKNPSNAKAWQKLIQSCKYFFAKNPIIVADCLDFCQGWVLSANTSAGRLEKRIPSNNISYKLWITEKLRIYGANRKYVSSIIPQIYRCDATKLLLHGPILSYNEFLFLSRSAEVLHLDYSGVKNGNGVVPTNEESSIIPLEKLVKTLVNLKEINW
uniref:Uncharacterized protein n=1 Tax=Panagrolaimus davidi TaxID=227884 RepID=A0A914QY34_9BILA